MEELIEQLNELLVALQGYNTALAVVGRLGNELTSMASDHDCINDEWGSGKCPHWSHQYELMEQRPSESEEYVTANS